SITANDSSVIAGSNNSPGTKGGLSGVVVTNLVLSGSHAYITGSTVHQDGSAGAVSVTANDNATINATALTEILGKDAANIVGKGDIGNIGFILAFNTIGWQAENVLALGVDALLGGDVVSGNTPNDISQISPVFGGEKPDVSEA